MPAPDLEHLLTLLQQFLQAPTWPDSRHIVETHPELLTDDADALLGQLREAQETEDVRQTIQDHSALLRRCREVGVDAAFAEKTDNAAGDNNLQIPPEFTDDVRELQSVLSRLQREPHLVPRYVAILECMKGRPEITRYPAFEATMLNDLGVAYYSLPTGDRSANLARAIYCYEEALRFRTTEAAPLDYAMTQNNLGVAYYSLPTGDRGANLACAIACYEAALRVYTPEAAPFQYATMQNNLGTAYSDLPTGDWSANLARAIYFYEEALRFRTPEAVPLDYAATQNNLGTAYSDLPTGDRSANLERAIQCYEQALRFYTPEAAPLDYAMTQNNLGNAYSVLPTGDRGTNLARAIQCYEEALRFRTPEAASLDYAATQNNLGIAHNDLPTGDRSTNLARAIECYEQALRFYTPEAEPLDYAMTQDNLGNAYGNLPTGDREANLARAIQCYEEALRFRTPEAAPLDYAMTQNNLGNTYSDLLVGDREMNLTRAIQCYEKALRFYTPEAMPFDYAMTQNNLGIVYWQLPTGDREANLTHAIQCYEESLRFRTPEAAPLDYAMTQDNLGNAYGNLPTGDRSANLARAIQCYEEALRFRTPEAVPLDYAATQNNLGIVYWRLPVGNRGTNLARAIQCYERALRVYTSEAAPLDYAMTQNNLGIVYWQLPTGDRVANITRAIQCYKRALRVYTSEAAPLDYAMTQNNLGEAYSDLPTDDRGANLARAIECYEEALRFWTSEAAPFQYATTQNNLGTAYSDLPTGDRGANLAHAIQCYERALHFQTPEVAPDDHRRTQRDVGRLYFEQGCWVQAAVAYQGALDASEFLYQAAAMPAARQAELREVRNLPGRLAYSLVRQEPAPQLQDAVLSLEQNRARWLSEALALHSQKPPNVPESVWRAFATHRERIQQLQAEIRLPEDTPGRRDYLTLSPELAAVYTALDETVTRIREHDDTFMPAPTFDQIQAAVKADCPLIYFAVSPAGTVAFVVTPTGVHPVHVPLTEDELGERIQGSADAPELGYLGAYAHDPVWFAALDETAHWLWDTLMGPVVEFLTGLGIDRAVLVPQGNLVLLPLHTAWTEANGKRRYAMDDVCFTYAPNARALSSARATAARVHPDRLFAIDEPQPVSAGTLPNSNAEVSAACEHFTHRKVLGGDSATEQAVRDQLSHHTVLHFSCHGFAGFSQPLDGGLLMAHDETLTLRDILALRLENTRLAVLSACETGIPGTELPDEVISLPTGLAQAGIAGVVASLWFVSDLSTMMLMARFYELWKRDGLEPPAALRQAQLWMRDATNGQKAEYFKDFLPEFKPEPRTGLPIHVADTLYKASILSLPDDNDFAHPFYWAAFTYTGV